MKAEFLYKHFMLVPSSHLPVVDGQGLLKGFLSKEKLKKELADFSEPKEVWQEIPNSFLDKELPEGLIEYLQSHPSIPVLDLSGNRISDWDKSKLLYEYSKVVPKSNSESKPKEVSESQDPKTKDPVSWLMRKILESFADPLLATDTAGNHLFFNESFEKRVLKKPYFRNSIEYAEKFFREFSKDTFAKELKNHQLDIEKVFQKGKTWESSIPQVGYSVKIILLTEKEKTIGYLYHFREMFPATKKPSPTSGKEFPSLDEAFEKKYPLEPLFRELESLYILKSLQRNQGNISHTAKELGIPRSTLQNKIRQLEIEVGGERVPIEKKPTPSKPKSKSTIQKTKKKEPKPKKKKNSNKR